MSEKVRLLVVDDDKSIQTVLKFVLKDEYDVTVLGDGQEAIDTLYKEKYDVVLMDIKMPKVSGLEALRKIQKIAPETDVIMLTATLSSDVTSEAMKSGAVNYLTKPFETEELKSVLAKLTKKKKVVSKSGKIQVQINSNVKFGELIGSSSEMTAVRSQLEEAVKDAFPITIIADKGSEVDMAAYSIFELSKSENFIFINCARDNFSVSDELFGDLEESSTAGILKVDSPKIVYLKNIQALNSQMQKKLINWFEDRYQDRNGYGHIRLVCAVCEQIGTQELESILDAELCFYIGKKIIKLPSIGERLSDLSDMIDFYLEKYNQEFSSQVKFSEEEKSKLLTKVAYRNYKQIENIIKRVVLLADENEPEVEYTPLFIMDSLNKNIFSFCD